ncbi:MAG: ABC transporter ATP-binding protein [Acetobacteraceae bacterium]
MADVRLEGIRKSYGAVAVFDGFDLEVRDGELLCLLGPSGSGKSTLMRLIAGLEPMQAGRIMIGERDVTTLEPRERRIGMTFQNYALYPHLSVRRNLRYPLVVRRVPSAEADRRVAAAAELLGIGHLLERGIRQISGGEQQRVAIGRAIVQEPDLYLLDEPISNLDASLREQVRGELRRLQQKLGATMIMVTHDQLDALAVADRIAIMHHGKLQQIGTPETLYHRPDNLFVAGFIGRFRMNFLTGRLSRRSGVAFDGNGFSLPLPPQAAARLPDGAREIVIGVRPEGVEVLADPAPGAVTAHAAGEFFHGEQTAELFNLGAEPIQAVLPRPLGLSNGAPAWLRLLPEALHFFDRETGKRLAEPERTEEPS